MNRFLAALLIFVFFWAVVGPVAVGFFTLFALTTGLIKDISAGSNLWTVRAGSLTGTFLGLYFAAQRVRKNAPWKMTIVHRGLIFGCFYYVGQALWLLILFSVNESSAPPGAFSVRALSALDYVIRFPASVFDSGLKNSLAGHYTGLFIASVFWALIFCLILFSIKRLKAQKAGNAENA